MEIGGFRHGVLAQGSVDPFFHLGPHILGHNVLPIIGAKTLPQGVMNQVTQGVFQPLQGAMALILARRGRQACHTFDLLEDKLRACFEKLKVIIRCNTGIVAGWNQVACRSICEIRVALAKLGEIRRGPFIENAFV